MYSVFCSLPIVCVVKVIGRGGGSVERALLGGLSGVAPGGGVDGDDVHLILLLETGYQCLLQLLGADQQKVGVAETHQLNRGNDDCILQVDSRKASSSLTSVATTKDRSARRKL